MTPRSHGQIYLTAGHREGLPPAGDGLLGLLTFVSGVRGTVVISCCDFLEVSRRKLLLWRNQGNSLRHGAPGQTLTLLDGANRMRVAGSPVCATERPEARPSRLIMVSS